MTNYRGRFAPTPSGPLHLGSLLAALASYLQARHRGGRWLLRIDDLDSPRCPPGMDLVIQRQLQAHGLNWDESPRYQSAQLPEYQSALQTLRSAGRLYACQCSRAELARIRVPGPDEPVYSGHCRDRQLELDAPGHSLRMRLASAKLALDDGIQGLQHRNLATEVGDFVVKRSDGQLAYQLACAIDEQAMGITEVVRGADLLGSSFQQLCVMDALAIHPPRYLHLPVLLGPAGGKLSKQNHAAALPDAGATDSLRRCLRWLGQEAPPVAAATAAQIVHWATANWDVARIPAQQDIPAA